MHRIFAIDFANPCYRTLHAWDKYCQRGFLLVSTAWAGKVGSRRGALGRGASVPKALEPGAHQCGLFECGSCLSFVYLSLILPALTGTVVAYS